MQNLEQWTVSLAMLYLGLTSQSWLIIRNIASDTRWCDMMIPVLVSGLWWYQCCHQVSQETCHLSSVHQCIITARISEIFHWICHHHASWGLRKCQYLWQLNWQLWHQLTADFSPISLPSKYCFIVLGNTSRLDDNEEQITVEIHHKIVWKSIKFLTLV